MPTVPFRPNIRLAALLGALALALTVGGAGRPAGGQRDVAPGVPAGPRTGPDSTPGELHRRVVSATDSTQSYALLLPPGYAGEEPRPLLVVLDPRGRALGALEIFRRPAARRGWMVMSSYETRSDTADASVNERALRAMLGDAEAHLALDGQRIYLAGFSGTARLGWLFAAALPDHVAGLVGVGAGFPPALRTSLLADADALPATFSFWGGSGVLDFNYEEVRRLDEDLDELGVRHRVEHYPGGHAWLPAEQARRALEGLELQAVRDGLTPADDGFVDSLYRRAVGEARAAEEAGRMAEALDRWRRVAADYEGLRPVGEARRRAAVLAGHAEVRRRDERRRRAARRHEAFTARLAEVLERLSGASPPPRAEELASELDLEGLRAEAGRSDTAPDARVAGRLLELVYTQASVYLPRRALGEGEPDRALAALELAERARPGRPRVRWQRARALAQAGRPDEAFAALSELPAGFPARLVADDPWLAPLRQDPRWEGLLERLR